MNTPTSVWLADPGPETLVTTLDRVAQEVHFTPRGWSSVGTRVASSDEGKVGILHPSVQSRRQGKYLHVSWWTDHRGGKQVRVQGGRMDDGRRHGEPDDERPPLWHTFPGRMYRVQRGDGAPIWLASCACGMTGDPRSLAWMGPRCGPCHDRREEGELGLPVEPPTLLREGDTVYDLAFDPKGTALAASLSGRMLTLVSVSDRSEQIWIERMGGEESSHLEFHPLVFSPDGAWLAVGDSMAGEPVLWPYSNGIVQGGFDQVVVLPPGSTQVGPVRDLTFSPDSSHFAVCDDFRNGRLFRKVGSRGWPEVCSLRGATALAFAPNGQTLAVGGSSGTVRLFSVDRGRQLGVLHSGARSDEPVLLLSWGPEENALVLVTGSEDAPLGEPTHQLRRWDTKKGRETHHTPIAPISLAAVTPDGRYLATVHHDHRHSPAAVHIRDLQTWRKLGWIESDPEEAVYALSFSPNGETLAIGSFTGDIKIVPWRLLLEV